MKKLIRPTSALSSGIFALVFSVGLLVSPSVSRAASHLLQQENAGGGAVNAEPAEEEVALPVPQTVITRVLANGIEVRKQAIPGIEYTAVIVELKTGDNHDPNDAPGLSQFLIDLAATASLRNDAEPRILSLRALEEKYPAGWSAQSHPDHTILGFVIPAEDLAGQIRATATRIQNVEFDTEALDHAVARVYTDLDRRFKTDVQLIPMSWVTARAFRHSSGALRGISPEALSRLTTTRLTNEWQRRIHPHNIRLYLTGNLGADETTLNTTIEESFGAFGSRNSEMPEFKVTVRPAESKERRRRIQVMELPSPKEHVVAAYYAPNMTDPEHPAFLTICSDFMNTARQLPGAQSRVAFQYSMLLDPRAAYLTPHLWRFPKGAGQALGFWSVKMQNKRFASTAGKATLRQLAWQLGEDLQPGVIKEIKRTPAVLFTIAYAGANRARVGDALFWENYRNRLARLRKEDLEAARDKYLLQNANIAVFTLTPPGQ